MVDSESEEFLIRSDRDLTDSTVSRIIGKPHHYDSVLSILLARAARCITFSATQLVQPTIRNQNAGDAVPIEKFLKELKKVSRPTAPRKKRVHGVFFASLLLYQGWWSRLPEQRGLDTGDWEDGLKNPDGDRRLRNIRHWLNAGYEQWGPSWDLWNPGEADQFLFGQIGHGDEANSLPVIVAPLAAQKIKADLGKNLAAEVTLKGTLYHDKYNISAMNENVKRAIRQPTKYSEDALPYFLVINDVEADGEESEDFIRINYGKNREIIYSAYMWQCLIRESDAFRGRRGVTPPRRSIFIWEHTNTLDRDTIAYNYASLQDKKKYLEEVFEEPLSVLQHSYSVSDILSERTVEPLFTARQLSKKLAEVRAELMGSDAGKPPADVVDITPHKKKSG
jgi:hypothetical protein